jgi:hypothetical protein
MPTGWAAADMPGQHGRTALVTGANSGIGFTRRWSWPARVHMCWWPAAIPAAAGPPAPPSWESCLPPASSSSRWTWPILTRSSAWPASSWTAAKGWTCSSTTPG